MAEALAERRLAGAVWRESRPDLLVHALAQLPEDVLLELDGIGVEEEGIRLLARAYGLEERVAFRQPKPGGRGRIGEATLAEVVEPLWTQDDDPARIRVDLNVLAGARVAVITNIPAPYRIPLFECLAQRLAEADARFRVVFLSRAARGRPWMRSPATLAFEHEFTRSCELPLGPRRALVPLDLERRLLAYRPSIVVTAGLSPAVSGRAILAARRLGAVVGVWSGETRVMGTATRRVRRLVRRRILDAADFAIAYGFEAGEYLRGLVPALPLVYGRNTSGTNGVAQARSGRPRVVEILAVADLASARKGIDVLVDALALVPALGCRLTVIGDGGLRTSLERRAADDPRIRFVGALPPARTLERYARSDVFAFPTRADVYGLALVEAMGAGLAVVTSAAPGAVSDLALSGRNCLVVNSHRADEWAAALERVVGDEELRRSLGEAAERTIRRRWTIEHACESFLAGLRLGLLTKERVAA